MKDPITDIASPAPSAADFRRLPLLPPAAALVEIAVVFGLIQALDWLQPGLELFDFRPHPYWLPVLLLSLQYGTVSGLLAAAIAIALTASAGFPEQSPTQTYFAYLVKIWLEPLLWISAAVLIGQFRMRQIARKDQLADHVEELASQRAAIADYARNLRTHSTALERQLATAGGGDTVAFLGALATAHADVARDGGAAVRPAFAALIGAALPGARASLYAAEAGGLRLIAGDGAELISADDNLHRAIVNDGYTVSVLNRDGELLLGRVGLAAAPVVTTTGGRARVIGMIRIDTLAPSRLNEPLMPALTALGHLVAPLLPNQPGVAIEARPSVVATAPAAGFLRRLSWLRGKSAAATSDVQPVTARSATRANR